MIYSLIFSTLLMHPLHETVAEVQWNPKTQRLEVAMRLHAMDAQWLRKRSLDRGGQKVSKTAKSADGVWQIGYLKRNFLIHPAASPKSADGEAPQPHRFRWVGKKQDGAHTWWFFEIEPSDHRIPSRIESHMLFEMEKDFVHRVIVLPPESLRQKKRDAAPVALTLTIQHPVADLKPSQPNANASKPERRH